MDDTSTKVNAKQGHTGSMGQKILASGERVAMRLWEEGPVTDKAPSARPYETVGYVIEGQATLFLENEKVELNPGDSWVVPRGKTHHYEIRERFKAIEATAPPSA